MRTLGHDRLKRPQQCPGYTHLRGFNECFKYINFITDIFNVVIDIFGRYLNDLLKCSKDSLFLMAQEKLTS